MEQYQYFIYEEVVSHLSGRKDLSCSSASVTSLIKIYSELETDRVKKNMKNRLALLGGQPIADRNFKRYQSIGAEETVAVNDVMKSGTLSAYYGSWERTFWVAPKVRNLNSGLRIF